MFKRLKIRIILWVLKKYVNRKNLIKWAKKLLRKVESIEHTRIDNEIADHLRKELGLKK